jgi:uncharacterized membrane protein (UPF0127 family)
VCFEKSRCIKVEVMSTAADREKGLMYRDSLGDDEGMLFVFDAPGRYAFWMKNMKFPIDMIWLDDDKKIVHIEREVPPCNEQICPSYNPGALSKYVIETHANFSIKNNLTDGQSVKI